MLLHAALSFRSHSAIYRGHLSLSRSCHHFILVPFNFSCSYPDRSIAPLRVSIAAVHEREFAQPPLWIQTMLTRCTSSLLNSCKSSALCTLQVFQVEVVNTRKRHDPDRCVACRNKRLSSLATLSHLCWLVNPAARQSVALSSTGASGQRLVRQMTFRVSSTAVLCLEAATWRYEVRQLQRRYCQNPAFRPQKRPFVAGGSAREHWTKGTEARGRRKQAILRRTRDIRR